MSDTGIINPLAPLAYLPPTLAVQFEASRYLYVATLGAFIWDWLMSMGEEYRMVTKFCRVIPTIVYFISRVAALAYILTSTLFQVGRVPNCQALQVALALCYFVTVPAASGLFYLRVRAVFHDNPLVRGLFAVLWLSVLGGSLTIVFAIKGIHIGPTQYCINSEVQSFSSTAVITSTINDSLVFLAISYRLSKINNMNERWQDFATSFFRGNGFTTFSKALYQGGQIYYLSTVGMNILTLTMVLTPSAPAVYRAMFTVPNNALQCVMACRVFRQLRLGMLGNEDANSGAESRLTVPLAWRAPHIHTTGIGSGTVFDSKPKTTLDTKGYDSGSGIMSIKVTQDVEMSIENENK